MLDLWSKPKPTKGSSAVADVDDDDDDEDDYDDFDRGHSVVLVIKLQVYRMSRGGMCQTSGECSLR